MKTSEVQKFINKRVKLIAHNDKKVYIGLFYIDPYTQNCKRPYYKIANEGIRITYAFRPSHIKSIKEL